MHLTYRKTCRACGSSALERVIDLGEQYIQGAFLKPGETPPLRRIPLVLMRCDPTMDERACGLLQTSCTVPAEILYSRYWYRSGTNQTMKDHLRGIVERILSMQSQPRLRVLDIGCNDGTLLGFYPDEFDRFGIDPSNAIDEIRRNDFTLIKDRFPSEELAAATKTRRFDVITSIAMFYDLEDPVEFVRAIRDVLAPDGLWIFEMSYMPSMLEMNSYDTICHEHLEYYSLAVVEWVLSKAGMKVVRAELNDINGGSIRCYSTPVENYRFRSEEDRAQIEELRKAEFDLALDTGSPYRSFQERVNAHRDELTRLVKDYKRAGKRIHVYGASTKGNTILQFCGLDNSLIDFAADRNPDKYGARTIGTDIPIISEEESRGMRPDLYLVLPWHFQKEFLERERNTLSLGTAMIFPLPQIKLVTADGEI
jgi:SAM-dependent methyltransferase